MKMQDVLPVEETGIVIRVPENKDNIEYVEIRYILSCPICGSNSVGINGRCKTCISCGWSSCEI